MADGDIKGKQLVDNTVTLGKVQQIAANRLLGNDTGSPADIKELTKAEALALLNVEDGADVTDGTAVAAAGAVMEADTSTSLMQFVLDEDNMASDSATKLATQQSIKAYVDGKVSGGVMYQGGYNAATNTPDLDVSPSGVLKGDMYTVTAAGTFFTVSVEAGDVLIAEVDAASAEADWTIVQANLTPASIKSAYESNSDTNAFTDAEQTKLGNLQERTPPKTSGTCPATSGTDATLVTLSGTPKAGTPVFVFINGQEQPEGLTKRWSRSGAVITWEAGNATTWDLETDDTYTVLWWA